MVTWLYLTAIAIFLYTLEGLLQRVLAVDSKNQRALGFVFASMAAILALIMFIAKGEYKYIQLPSEPYAYIAIFIACISYAIYDRYRFKAAQMVQASTFATIATITVVIAFIISAILYHETITINKVFGFFLILGALVLIAYEPKKKKKKKEKIGLALFICIVVGIAWSLDKTGIRYFNAQTYNVMVWVVPAIFTYLPYIKPAEIKYEVKKASWKVVVLAFVNVLAYFCQLQAVALSEATKVIPLIQTYVITTVLFGIIFLKERDNLKKKTVASVLAVIGAILLI